MATAGFDRVASFYDKLGEIVFGGQIQEATAWGMSVLNTHKRILILGGGSGRLLKELPLERLEGEIAYLEPSPKMILLAQQYWETLSPNPGLKIEWVVASDTFLDENTIPFDAIISPFVLDLFKQEQLEVIFERLHQILRPGGHWLYSDFFIKRDSFRLFRRALILLMYLFFKAMCGVEAWKLPTIHKLFQEYEYQLIRREVFAASMIESVVFQKS
ncbi:MAG: methyltransferase [Bacteroidota bacterium]